MQEGCTIERALQHAPDDKRDGCGQAEISEQKRAAAFKKHHRFNSSGSLAMLAAMGLADSRNQLAESTKTWGLPRILMRFSSRLRDHTATLPLAMLGQTTGKDLAMRMNYRATAEYFEQRARRQRRHPSVRAHYAAEAERYRTLAKSQEEAEGADQSPQAGGDVAVLKG